MGAALSKCNMLSKSGKSAPDFERLTLEMHVAHRAMHQISLEIDIDPVIVEAGRKVFFGISATLFVDFFS